MSLASELEVEGGEADAEGLEERGRVRHVHVEVLLAHAPELHIYVIVVVLVYQLKVLDGGLIHAPIEVKHKRLHLCRHINTKLLLALALLDWARRQRHLQSFHLGGLLKKNMIFSVLFILNCSCMDWFFCVHTNRSGLGRLKRGT